MISSIKMAAKMTQAVLQEGIGGRVCLLLFPEMIMVKDLLY